MEIKSRRKKYFIHPSFQIKYIVIALLPALITGIFCAYFLIKTGELTLQALKIKRSMFVASLNYVIEELTKQNQSPEIIAKIKKLKTEPHSPENILRKPYFDVIKGQEQIKISMLLGLFSLLILIAVICLIYSHRIAGPLIRLKKSIDMFCEGKITAAIHLRKDDEFKELADSVEKLRLVLESKGILK